MNISPRFASNHRKYLRSAHYVLVDILQIIKAVFLKKKKFKHYSQEILYIIIGTHFVMKLNINHYVNNYKLILTVSKKKISKNDVVKHTYTMQVISYI